MAFTPNDVVDVFARRRLIADISRRALSALRPGLLPKLAGYPRAAMQKGALVKIRVPKRANILPCEDAP